MTHHLEIFKMDKIVPFILLTVLSSSTTIFATNKETIDGFLKTKEDISNFNNQFLLPRIKKLITNDHFRYVKVNLNRNCKLWCNADKCNLQDCKVNYKCPEYELSTVNTELASDQLDLFDQFVCYDTDDPDSVFVDLVINPERYTGYSGEPANRVWRAIYDENCFVRNSDLCFEERLFYEAISGLHSSINIHLCAEYPGVFGLFEPNVEEFISRFDGHNDYLENLYTLFLLELRALTKTKHCLDKVSWRQSYTRGLVEGLLNVATKLNIPHFEELSLKPTLVSQELAIHFRNITTTIMDCVGCEKCKLWGIVQLRGLGAAFRILTAKNIDTLVLKNQEIVSLVNSLARLSHSIHQLEVFRGLLLFRNKKYNVNR